jgi:hypothetical protein
MLENEAVAVRDESGPSHARRGVAVAVLLAAVFSLAGALPAGAATSARAAHVNKDRLCSTLYPGQKRKTENIHFGKKTTWNWTGGADLVCTEAFGVPDGVHLTPAAICDLAAAGYGLVDPSKSFMSGTECFAVAAMTEGGASAVKGALCGFLADTFGVGVGIFVAGATLNPEFGVPVYKGVAFFGNSAVCVGLLDGGAKAWGAKLESNHEVAVARDVTRHGKCIQYRQRRVWGSDWRAITCPHGWGRPAPTRYTPAPEPVQDVPADQGPPTGGDGDSGPSGPGAGDPGGIPIGSTAETAGGVTHTWTNPVNAGGSEGPSIQAGQSVGVACKIAGFRVADGNTWWYRIASSPWSNGYYASADAFYNNGQTSGSLLGTPFVDAAVPDCLAPTPAPVTYTETVGGVTHTWTNPANAGGTQGPSIATSQTVQIACKLQGFRVADGNTWWYRIASSPWNSAYYASADAFYNNGQTSGSLLGTPFVDGAVRDC